MLTKLWVKILKHKTELFFCLYLLEGTEIVANSIEDDVWGDKYERTCDLNDKVESWD